MFERARIRDQARSDTPARQQTPDHGKPSRSVSVLLNAQEHQPQARHNDQQSQLEVLAAVQEFVPRPQPLRDGHRDRFNSNQDEENTTETSSGAQSGKQRLEKSPREDGDLDHAGGLILPRRNRWLSKPQSSIPTPGAWGYQGFQMFLLFRAVDPEQADVVAVDVEVHIIGELHVFAGPELLGILTSVQAELLQIQMERMR